MLPFPGDWHILYNYQKVLLKIYGDAGLLQLEKVAGHRSETLKSLAQASHFKRTHHFILQSFEAIYRLFLRLYLHSLETTPEAPPSQIPPSQATPLSANPQVPTSTEAPPSQIPPSQATPLSANPQVPTSPEAPPSHIPPSQVRATANTLAHQLAKITSEAELEDFQKHMNTVFNTTLSNFSAGFHSFMETLCSRQQTCQFWYEYIITNSLVYMTLFIAIRNGDWVLRMTAIKLMAAVFSAFDRPIYQCLVPQQLADLLCFPAPILQHLQKGAISVRLTKSKGHAVGLDEAHEMKINKDAKFSVV